MVKQKGKYIFKLFAAALILLTALTGKYAIAMDEGGCLTCHKYPGLVRTEKSKGLKVLHIDEEAYLRSPHGQIDCRECHTGVTKVPHTGEDRVDCTSECHLSDEEIQQVKSYDRSKLHEKEQSYLISLKDETSCKECHSLYPHSERNSVRSLLNMHTGFMTCEVCHVKRNKHTGLRFEWVDSENAQYSGKPFGSRFYPKTGITNKNDNFISRITVYSTDSGNQKLLTNTWDTKKARRYLSEEANMHADEKKRQLKYFHKDIDKKEISVACNECHSTKSILDYKKLGFDKKKTQDLIYLNVKGLVTKYKTFYFPKLF